MAASSHCCCLLLRAWRPLRYCLWLAVLFSLSSGFSSAEIISDESKCFLLTQGPTPGSRRCYIIVSEVADWQSAKNSCVSMGAHLLTVTSPKEHEDIVLVMSARSELGDIWLGVEEYMGAWSWEDGRDIFQQGCFKDDKSNPDFPESTRALNGNNSYSHCRDTCQKQGYKYGALQDKVECWCGQSFGKHGSSQDGCTSVCPESTTQMCGGPNANYVIAVTGTFSNWGNGLPNNHLGYQTCGELETRNRLLWNDAKCTEAKGVICQTAKNTSCDNSTSPDLTYLTQQSSSCYYISKQTMTWFEAKYFCHQSGGQLAVIDNENLNTLIVNQLRNMVNLTSPDEVAGFWIGLSRSKWTWITGEEFLYSNWESDDPNGKLQHCIVMDKTGMWQDRVCDGRSMYICEIDTSLPAEETTTKPVPQSTTTAPVLLRPVRTEGRRLPFTIEDEQLAAIVAGGVVMLVILIIVLSVHCHIQRKKNARLKEAKKDSKREKFFFGLNNEGKEIEEAEGGTLEKQKIGETNEERNSLDSNQINQTIHSDLNTQLNTLEKCSITPEGGTTADDRSQITSPVEDRDDASIVKSNESIHKVANRNSTAGNDITMIEDFSDDGDGKEGSSHDQQDIRHSRLSQKPDVIPDSDLIG